MTTLDVSIYDYDTFEEDCFKANGVERLIVGTSNLGASRAMIMRGRRAGITVEDLYGFIYYGLGWENRDLDNCLQLAAELGGIKRIWLDCESGFSDNGIQDDTEAPGVTVAYRHERTMRQALRVEEAGLQAGIYTGAYWWPSKMGNSPAFSALGLPLWLANYGANDPNNPRPPITEVNFGGWTKLAAHQYSSTIGLCGRDVRDHNYWFLEEGLSVEDKARLDRLEKLLAGNGIAKDPAAYVASGYDSTLLTFGEEALAYAAEKQWSAFLGVGLAQDSAAHSHEPSGGGTRPGDKVDRSCICNILNEGD